MGLALPVPIGTVDMVVETTLLLLETLVLRGVDTMDDGVVEDEFLDAESEEDELLVEVAEDVLEAIEEMDEGPLAP